MKYRVKQSIVKDGTANVTFECGLRCLKPNHGQAKDVWLYYVPNTIYKVLFPIANHPDKEEIKKAIESHFGSDEEFREVFG